MAEEYGIQTTIVLAEESMAKVADKVGKMFANKIASFQTGMKYPSTVIGPTATPGMGLAAKAGGVAGKGAEAVMGGMGKTLGMVLKSLGPIAIIAAILANIMKFIEPFIKLFSFLVLILLVPVFRLLKTAMNGIVAFFGDPLGTLIGIATAIVGGLIGIFTGVENVFAGLADSKGNIDWTKLLLIIFAPIPMLLGPLIINAISTLMTMISESLPSFIASATKIIGGMIDWVGTSIFGKDIWANIKKAITYISEVVFNVAGGVWKDIEGAIGWLANVLFNKDTGFWKAIEGAIGWLATFLFATGSGAWALIQAGIKTIAEWLDPSKTLATIKKGIDFIGTSIFGETVWKDIQDAITWLNNNIFGPLVWDPIKIALTSILDALQKAASSLALIKIGSTVIGKVLDPLGILGFIGKVFGYGDFISRPGQPTATFSPDDTIIGVKNPADLMGKGGGGMSYSPVYNVQAGIDGEMLKKIFREHDDNFRREFLGRSSYVTNIRP